MALFDISRLATLLDKVKSPLTYAALISVLVSYIIIVGQNIHNLSNASIFLTVTGAMLVIAAAAVSLVIAQREGERGPMGMSRLSSVSYFDLARDSGKSFYNHIINRYNTVSDAIYMSGRGFMQEETERTSPFYSTYERYLASYEHVLRMGSKIVRIQTSDRFSPEWGVRILDLLNKYPDTFELFLDIDEAPLVNIAVIDTNKDDCEIHLLFESERFSGTSKSFGAVSGAFIRGHKELANGLRAGFIHRINAGKLPRVTVDNWQRYFGKYYFAYGSNIAIDRLKVRCPTAEKVTSGILYNWKLVFDVVAEHMGGSVAGIVPEHGESVEGVVFSISATDLEQLGRVEGGGYREQEVLINTNNGEFHATVFVPESHRRDANVRPSPQYVEQLLLAARTNNLTKLESTIHEVKK